MSVYFIRAIGTEGPIKIGKSDSPTHRRADLATWSPFPLELIAEIDGGTELEKRFHAKYFRAHERREWFTASPELLADIEKIKAGLFDVSTLPSGLNLPPRKYRRAA